MIDGMLVVFMNVTIGQKTFWWNGGKFLDKKVGGMK
jgi:hypothetical protein